MVVYLTARVGYNTDKNKEEIAEIDNLDIDYHVDYMYKR